MTTKKNLVKQVLMSTLTAGVFTFAFTACSDDLDIEKAPVAPEVTKTRSITGDETLRYNINEDPAKSSPTFNKDNWRQHNTIYLCYSNSNEVNQSIKDSEGRTGYREEVLPWAKSASPMSNLPNNFCNDVTPENGWELVANFCGDYYHPNAHFFVLYNKYMGKLRYFYFIPRDANTKDVVDHNWEIQMQDGVADHSVFGYAAPMDKKMKDPRAINAEFGGYWTQFVTPWTSTSNKLGQLKPNAGWYAYDVDLSVYRGEGNRISSNEMLKTSLCGYTSSNVDLYGKLNADIKGDMKLEKCCVNTTSGVFGPFEEILSQAKGIKDFIGGAKDVYQNLMSGDILGAIEGGINVAKQGCDIVGIDYGAETTGFNGYKGDVNLRLNGTIDMAGKITGEQTIEGFSNLEQSLTYFDFENSTVGQGVWNLETSPVVYYTNAYVKYTKTNDFRTPKILSMESPFGGYGDVKPWHGHVCYFDPSSIKLALNPNVFTPEEIASAKVYAICGVRNGMHFGDTQKYRNAMGLSKGEYGVNGNVLYGNIGFDETPFDALSGSKETMGMKTCTKFGVDTYEGREMAVFGRGDANYLVEPQALHGKNGSDWMPAYEVTVTVMVMHNGSPIVYSRTYLPEYKLMNISDMPSTADMMKKRPEAYSADIYAQQMARYDNLKKWFCRRFQPVDGTPIHFMVLNHKRQDINKIYVSPTEAFPAALDGNPATRWVAHIENREHHTYLPHVVKYSANTVSAVKNNPWYQKPVWFMEFKTNLPVSPRSYSLISANDAGKYPQCNPRVFGLWGRKSPNDPWTQLAFSSYNNQPEDMLPKANSKPTNEIPFRFNKCDGFQYFRFEVFDVADENLIRLGDIQFNYDD